MSNSAIQPSMFRGWPTVDGGIPISDHHTVANDYDSYDLSEGPRPTPALIWIQKVKRKTRP